MDNLCRAMSHILTGKTYIVAKKILRILVKKNLKFFWQILCNLVRCSEVPHYTAPYISVNTLGTDLGLIQKCSSRQGLQDAYLTF